LPEKLQYHLILTDNIIKKLKVLAIIQARTGSTRLPRKALRKIQGKPILHHIIDFLGHSKQIDKIIVATTTLKNDDEIVDFSKQINVDCFRGSSDDVLGRYYECAKHYGGELIVRITSDNPLIDPELVDKVIRVCKETNCKYASNMIHQTYPLGYLVEALTFPTLKKLHENYTDPLNREHVTYAIRQNPKSFDVQEIFAPSDLERPNWRLTVDYEDDFNLISEIYSKLYKSNHFIPYRAVVEFLDKNKDLLKINQKTVTFHIQEGIRYLEK